MDILGGIAQSTSRSFPLEPSKILGKEDEASSKLKIDYSGG